MSRLGDDQNMATAYPDRVNMNLRGRWMRQLAMTMVGTLLLYNVMFKDYKDATKAGMSEKGIADKIDIIIPKTNAEKKAEAEKAKLALVQKRQALQYEVGNLTNAVVELQYHMVKLNGVTLQHPINDTYASKDGASEGDGGGDGGDEDQESDHPRVMLRGAETEPEGVTPNGSESDLDGDGEVGPLHR